MRLFLSETFFEKMIVLPKSIQQKVLLLLRRYTLNPSSSIKTMLCGRQG